MYIGRVVLKNIKGLSEVDFDFQGDAGTFAGWSVITGDNGSGKSALLRAISLALLGPDQSRALVPDLSGWVTRGQREGSISVEVLPDHSLDKTALGGFPSTSFWAEVKIVQEGEVWTLQPTDVFRKKRKGAHNGPWAPSTAGWFALGYGPFRRMYGSSPDAQRLMVLPGRIPHFATLFKVDATLGEGEEWVRTLNYKKLEKKEDEARTLEALLLLMRDEFLRHDLELEQINSDGMWLKDGVGRRIPLQDMSEGYRATLAMLVDIFRHMVDAYGIRGLVEEAEGGVIVTQPGVVLVDEVDAHLHPEWQRTIGFWLKQHFPAVQFIVSTHSPIVCQAADDGRVYSMGDAETPETPFRLSPPDYRRVIAGRPDQVLLTPAFGMRYTRSPRAVRARQRRAELLAKAEQLDLGLEEQQEMKQYDLFVEDFD